MPAGIQIFNTAGVIQIDQDTRNFVLTGKGTGTCSTPLGGGSWLTYYTDIVVSSATTPMIALKGNNSVGLVSVSVSGSTWTFRVAGANGATFSYYIFDVASGSYGNVGFQIFNAAGEVVFHTAALPLRVVDFIGRGESIAYTSGRNYAVIQSNPGAGQTAPDDITGEFDDLLAASYVSGATVNTANFVTRHGITGSIGGDYEPDVRFLVCDVTNY